ncbi:MAG TPA: beta-phosphoglucomutase [Rhizomicrobium sp.]|nr:beta-phosphoglucomutase [Rhizomicrobium sp.]
MSGIEACLFDLDGVIVDTAKYHFIAWRQIAEELGFVFTEKDNERLKGVSRQRSLDILLEVGGISPGAEAKEKLAARKNGIYLDYIRKLSPQEILPGAESFLKACRAQGLKTALATASRNSALILDLLKIRALFDAVVDGNKVKRTKPDPEVFLLCAKELGVAPAACVVFEDAEAGIAAARAAGMFSVGIGKPAILKLANIVAPGLAELSVEEVLALAERGERRALQ